MIPVPKPDFTLYIEDRMEAADKSQCVQASAVRVRSLLTAGGISAVMALAFGLMLRLWMLHWVFDVPSDSLNYGGIAKNLLLHGRYALTADGEIYPTLIRLPGYPLFLAACFRVFGMENYWAGACVQIALDLAGCLLLADFTRLAARGVRSGSEGFARRAALATLWLAALCPFTASYTALPLAEAPTLFVLALAMDAMARFRERPRLASAVAFTFAVTAATLLRPDGVLAAIAFVPVMLLALRQPANALAQPQALPAKLRASSVRQPAAKTVDGDKSRRGNRPASPRRMVLVCTLIAVTPFAAWTWRNWQVFDVFEPLAPRLATDPGEATNPGWERWVKSWCLDFISTYQIYWNVPGGPIDVSQLPSRAFDSPAQFAETAALFHAYNSHGEQLTPALDARFDSLAAERIAAHPLRYFVWLPLGRVADMWMRPRVEELPIDIDWWVYAHHNDETVFSWLYAALNALILLLAAAGVWVYPRYSNPLWKPLLAYLLLRSALLLTVEAPETRYTIECFPMLLALAGVAIAAGLRRIAPESRV